MVLQSNNIHNGTFIPNLFIDRYMPAANGAYVKVYLYLLRILSDTSIEKVDISSIADYLDNTESDIIRALCYWEKVGLISIARDDKDNITSVTINDINSLNNDSEHKDEPAATIEYEYYSNSSQDYMTDTDNMEHQDELDNLKELSNDNANKYQFEKPTYSDAQIKQLTDSDEIKWMLNIIELYLQRLIKPTDLQLVLYLYESLNFSTELILYLYEYCVSKNKTHPSYVEAVAVAWAKEGVDTLEKAEEATVLFNENYNSVKKAFGLNRALGHVEKQYINKWTKEYNFPIEIVTEACNRTLLNIQKPDFKYTDKIIENWHNKGVKTLKEVKSLDEEHAASSSKSKQSSEGANKNNKPSRQSNNNRFNAFPQRSYSKEDYSSLEKKLLHKQ